MDSIGSSVIPIMKEQINKGYTPGWVFSLNDDELSYVLTILGAQTIPGLPENTFKGITEDTRSMAENLVQRSLLAKGYAVLGENGSWNLEPSFANLVRLLIRPAYLLTVVVDSVAASSPFFGMGFFAPDILILQSLPYPYSHQFEVFFDASFDLAGFLLSLIGDFETNLPELSAELPKSEIRLWFESGMMTSPEHLRRSSNGRHDVVETIEAVLKRKESSVILTLSSLLGEEILTTQASVIGGTAGYAVLLDPSPASDGNVWIESGSLQRIKEVTAQWLGQLLVLDELA